MKGFWKWFLIVVGVLILIGLIATPFVMHSVSRAGFYPMMQVYQQGDPSFRGEFDRGQSLRGGYFGMPMHGRGLVPFGGFLMIPFFGLFCLFSLGILGFAIYGIVSLVNHPKSAKSDPAPVAIEQHTEPCTKCGKPVQDDWYACPNCGQKVRRPK